MKRSFAALTLFLAPLALASLVSQPSAHAAQSPKTIAIHAKRFSFDPADVTLKKGEPVTIEMFSDDVAHGLRVRELNLDVKAGKGASAQATITPDKTGDFVGHCSTFCGSGHGTMTVTFHVVP